MEDTNEGPVCIIGMHRSGTSMVANLLQRCGLTLGPEETLLGSNAGNQIGHFEHTGFLDINDALLRHFGGSWDNPPNLKAGWEQDPALGKLVHQTKKLLDTFVGSSCWGWKDPRTTILLPFWQRFIPNLRFVICVRNPLEVAQSLEKRDDLSIATAVHLWALYTQTAIQNTNGQPRILSFYEDYFRNLRDEVVRVTDFCGLKQPNDAAVVKDSILGELRHESKGIAELLGDRTTPLQCKLLYLGLRALSYEDLATSQVNSVHSEAVSVGVANLTRLMDEYHSQDRIGWLQALVSEKERKLGNLQSAIIRQERRTSHLVQENIRLQAFQDAVRQSSAYQLYRKFIKPFRK
jgi:hypothetical protein